MSNVESNITNNESNHGSFAQNLQTNQGNGTRSRRWCFTLNNYTPANLQDLRGAFSDAGRVRHHLQFIRIGFEIGDSGTPHLQGFLVCSQPKTMVAVKRIPGLERAHIESCRGSVQSNLDYCSKDGQFEDFGEAPSQGSRQDLQRIAQLVGEGKTLNYIAEQCPTEFIKFHKGIERLLFLRQPFRQFKTEVYWFYGPTGTGKSKTAFELAAMENSYYVKDPTNKWWDGYNAQDVVIIDDYRKDFCTFASMLRLFDRYPLSIECKGGTTQFLAKKIFVTTPKSPSETWDGRTSEDLQQLMRRITETRYFPHSPFNPNIRENTNLTHNN